jgi:hypothetical protein
MVLPLPGVGPRVRIRLPPAGSLQALGPCQRTRALNYLRFTLSYRDVEELLAERGLDLEQRLGGRPTGTMTVSSAKMNPRNGAQRFLFSGHFRQILSTLTRNGRSSGTFTGRRGWYSPSVH